MKKLSENFAVNKHQHRLIPNNSVNKNGVHVPFVYFTGLNAHLLQVQRYILLPSVRYLSVIYFFGYIFKLV
jgi:hypothetical protein